jgi:apolipoprotein N-acyltransferase
VGKENRAAGRARKQIAVGLLSPFHALLVILSAVLTVVCFPSFEWWFLAWISLTPLLLVITRISRSGQAFAAGCLWGIVFFYGSCWWLTYPMIHYGNIPVWLAYPVLLLPVMLGSLFPGLVCLFLFLLIQRFGGSAILMAPAVWVSFEWLRYVVTGQLWNALGYSQAFHPYIIQSARWGGVYLVSFLIVLFNAAIVYAATRQKIIIAGASILIVAGVLLAASTLAPTNARLASAGNTAINIIAIQPNVPMNLTGDTPEMNALLARHLSLTETGSKQLATDDLPVLVIWPESPMNFSYSRDPRLRATIENLARTNRVSLLLNSLEPAHESGSQNSAVLINEKGVIAARYDKIRLMPFGEYVPLPRWLPGAGSVRAIVGEFEPGSSYTLMPLGAIRAGVFICIEAAHPAIATGFTHNGADVLINISNDGYLGPTPVMRQHLANAIFRAVENNRTLVRVTNSGISALIDADGSVSGTTAGFQEAVRTWTINKGDGSTFYSRRGDVFVYLCALISLGFISTLFVRKRFTRARA